MPSWWSGYGRARRFCTRRVTWSITKGGCGQPPGHHGPCRPGRKRFGNRAGAVWQPARG